MLKSERIIGIIYLPIHIFLLPFLVTYRAADGEQHGGGETRAPTSFITPSLPVCFNLLFRY